ncbi:MAG TPA: hypothetical protein VFJ30_19345 [Phycisphaerae bacterium]|nr:hypothetical protein [Phycisphaerae bacterium]
MFVHAPHSTQSPANRCQAGSASSGKASAAADASRTTAAFWPVNRSAISRRRRSRSASWEGAASLVAARPSHALPCSVATSATNPSDTGVRFTSNPSRANGSPPTSVQKHEAAQSTQSHETTTAASRRRT